MPRFSEPPRELTTDMWSDGDGDGLAFDEACSPTRVCRNARQFDFEGIAEDGGDLHQAWRALLAREGKLDESGQSIRDLVLGPRGPD